ncbi:hypothetical protein CW304_13300 [Bacillus sp. UFRGS-B20]|nr:hypothetical protein CW304_13300 [Bacillus sp. UFRGS-B20]
MRICTIIKLLSAKSKLIGLVLILLFALVPPSFVLFVLMSIVWSERRSRKIAVMSQLHLSVHDLHHFNAISTPHT